MVIKHDKLNKKICCPEKKLKEMHEKYSDSQGFLNI